MHFQNWTGCLITMLAELALAAPACGGTQSTRVPAPAAAALPSPPTPQREPGPPPDGPGLAVATVGAPQNTVLRAPARCSPADWSARSLAPLLKPGKATTPSQPDRLGATQSAFISQCTDSPSGATGESPATVVIDGVEVRLTSAQPAGSSGRGWIGNQCSFELRLADGSGPPLRIGAREIPPFNTLGALVRAGSAAWLALSFNGYTAEFPKGGNRIVAVDLCDGRVVWQSKDSVSNGGLLLLGDYLISPYGFTAERRYVYVLDAHSGSVIQKLSVLENICPSKSWAPNWHTGEACDARGQLVGAATAPRVEGGLFLVDTNTGSSAFQFQ